MLFAANKNQWSNNLQFINAVDHRNPSIWVCWCIYDEEEDFIPQSEAWNLVGSRYMLLYDLTQTLLYGHSHVSYRVQIREILLKSISLLEFLSILPNKYKIIIKYWNMVLQNNISFGYELPCLSLICNNRPLNCIAF